jgi:hypothetical protein
MAGEGDVPRPLTARELIERLGSRSTADAVLSDASLVPNLRVMLWRWCRAAAHAVGRCSDDESLEQALGDAEPCPWTRRLQARPTPTQRSLIRHGATAALYEAVSAEGIPLLPPTDGGRVERWCDAFAGVAEDLCFRRAPRGQECLRVLEDPEVVRYVECSETAIVAVEELLTSSAARVLQRHGEVGVVDHFREAYGLSRREGLGLVRLARAWTLLYGRSSVEDDRAMMVAMLKDALARARETLNLGDELRCMKELARVQGLTRSEPEDREAEFLGVVRRVAGRQDAALALPGAAAPEPSERDALAEFDSEGAAEFDAEGVVR